MYGSSTRVVALFINLAWLLSAQYLHYFKTIVKFLIALFFNFTAWNILEWQRSHHGVYLFIHKFFFYPNHAEIWTSRTLHRNKATVYDCHIMHVDGLFFVLFFGIWKPSQLLRMSIAWWIWAFCKITPFCYRINNRMFYYIEVLLKFSYVHQLKSFWKIVFFNVKCINKITILLLSQKRLYFHPPGMSSALWSKNPTSKCKIILVELSATKDMTHNLPYDGGRVLPKLLFLILILDMNLFELTSRY